MPRRHAFSGHNDQSVVIEIDGIVIMIRGWLMSRAPGSEMINRLLVMAVAMASGDVITSVVMAMVMAVVVTMTGEMDMRSTGMPRSLGMHLLRMRHRNSAEKQMGGHEQYKEQSHGSSSLIRTTCPDNLASGAVPGGQPSRFPRIEVDGSADAQARPQVVELQRLLHGEHRERHEHVRADQQERRLEQDGHVSGSFRNPSTEFK
jgi:hypothetical protein